MPPRSINPWAGMSVISAAFPSPAKPFGGTGRAVCYCRVSCTQGCSVLTPPPRCPPTRRPGGGSPGLLPEEENHKPSAGAGRAPPARCGAGSQAASCLLAGPCRWLAAAPADLPNTPPCPRRSPGARCCVSPLRRPDATRKGSASLPVRSGLPALSSGSQILHF